MSDYRGVSGDDMTASTEPGSPRSVSVSVMHDYGVSQSRPRNILVTGGAGFIGGHLCEQLLKRGDHVVCIDNCNAYYDPAIKEATLQLLQEEGKERFTPLRVDVEDRKSLEAAVLPLAPFDTVCHLAAQAGVRHSLHNAASVVASNIGGTVNILELARNIGRPTGCSSGQLEIPNVIIASSSSVYGDNAEQPFTEGQRCDQPISPYAASKRSCELFAYTYSELYRMPVTCLRFFTVYGPRGRPDMAVYRFIDCISRGIPLTRFGNGGARREFTYISDVISGILSAIENPRAFDIINLGGGATSSVQQLISHIEHHTGRKAKIREGPKQPGDVSITWADHSRAKESLRFFPTTSLDQGVKRTVAWYNSWGRLKLGSGSASSDCPAQS